jgi:MFS transporter, FHS family, L-fucose permease
VVTARNAHVAMAIPMMGYALAYVFPIYINFFNKETMDSRRDTNLNIEPRPMEKEVELERNASNDEGTKQMVELAEQKAA